MGFYDEAVKYANTDNRVGKHQFRVTEVEADTWESGDARFKVRGELRTADGAKCDFTLSPVPDEATLEQEWKSYEPKKKRAIGGAIEMHQALKAHYDKTVDSIEEGDVFTVQTAKNKDGFIRVIKILKPSANGAGAGSTEAVPF